MLPPPKCLDAVRAWPAEPPDILLDTLTDSPNRFFSVGCPCGGTLFSVSGQITRNILIDQDLVYGPATVHCTQCDRRAVVFDPRLHGFDVELDHFPPTSAQSSPERGFVCPTCGHTVFGLVARFEYPARLLEALDSGIDPGYPANVGRERDLFTWFTLIGLCSACRQHTTVVSQECA
jgi:hypothetical protein